MTVLITGNAHSGTTFLARLLMELGCDFHPVDWIDSPHGMENRIVQGAAHAVTMDLVAGGMLPVLDRKLRPETRELVQRALRTMPKWTKMPNIGYTYPAWHEAGFRPEHIIVCHRELSSCARSNVRRNVAALPEMHTRLSGQLGYLAAALWEYQLRHTVILFPRSVEDPAYLFDALAPVFLERKQLLDRDGFLACHRRIAKKALVHVR
jgi:hypothetical protein